jgi:hypothetical protein
MTLPHFPPGTPEHRWMVEQVDAIVTRWETARDAATWIDPQPMCPSCEIRHAPPIHYDAG